MGTGVSSFGIPAAANLLHWMTAQGLDPGRQLSLVITFRQLGDGILRTTRAGISSSSATPDKGFRNIRCWSDLPLLPRHPSFLSLRAVPSFVLVVCDRFSPARISELVRAGIRSWPRASALPAWRPACADVPLRSCRWPTRYHPPLTSRVDEHQNTSVVRVSIAELTMFAMQAREETSRGIGSPGGDRALFRLRLRDQPIRRFVKPRSGARNDRAK